MFHNQQQSTSSSDDHKQSPPPQYNPVPAVGAEGNPPPSVFASVPPRIPVFLGNIPGLSAEEEAMILRYTSRS